MPRATADFQCAAALTRCAHAWSSLRSPLSDPCCSVDRNRGNFIVVDTFHRLYLAAPHHFKTLSALRVFHLLGLPTSSISKKVLPGCRFRKFQVPSGFRWPSTSRSHPAAGCPARPGNPGNSPALPGRHNTIGVGKRRASYSYRLLPPFAYSCKVCDLEGIHGLFFVPLQLVGLAGKRFSYSCRLSSTTTFYRMYICASGYRSPAPKAVRQLLGGIYAAIDRGHAHPEIKISQQRQDHAGHCVVDSCRLFFHS